MNNKLAVAYIRVSTNKQAASVETQREMLDEWSRVNGVKIVSTHEDIAVSGTRHIAKRRGLLAALDSISSSGAGLLVATYPDRFARSLEINEELDRELLKRGAEMLSTQVDGKEGMFRDLIKDVRNLFGLDELEMFRDQCLLFAAENDSAGLFSYVQSVAK